MKHLLLCIAICITSISYAQSTNNTTSTTQQQWKNIPAKKSNTSNPDDGYPNIKEVTPGTKIPTIGDIKRKVLDLLSDHHLYTSKRIKDISNYKNTGREAWDCTYWNTSEKHPEYDKVLSLYFYIGPDHTGRVSQRIALVGQKLVHKKTGKIMKQ
ncbi:MAG: hypothetical protein JKY44_03900 [Flavobacteriaceae bacterium]|nr:hypothetical protein [Flavobacteriaceae bacterium]